MKAFVALEHWILIAVWRMPTNGELYAAPGLDYLLPENQHKPRQPKPGPFGNSKHSASP